MIRLLFAWFRGIHQTLDFNSFWDEDEIGYVWVRSTHCLSCDLSMISRNDNPELFEELGPAKVGHNVHSFLKTLCRNMFFCKNEKKIKLGVVLKISWYYIGKNSKAGLSSSAQISITKFRQGVLEYQIYHKLWSLQSVPLQLEPLQIKVLSHLIFLKIEDFFYMRFRSYGIFRGRG